MSKKRISRRDFITRTAAATAALSGGTVSGAEKAGPAAVECGSTWDRPPKQQGNGLNLILIVADTFRRDNLACYGSQWVECPNLNRFAQECVIFDDFFPEGMPTIPTRRNLHTGRRIFPFHYHRQHDPVLLPGWHPLYNEDVTLSEVLWEAGYIPALVADVPHMQRPGMNFHRGYRFYEWIRGQENDYYGTSPHKPYNVSDIVPDDYLAQHPNLRGFLSQYRANRLRWGMQCEALVELVARLSIRWLRVNSNDRPFFLHVESFDPHEPWDPPEHFLRNYLRRASGPTWIEPPYEDVQLSPEATRRMRANYAGEAQCVDFWLGRLLETIREYGLLENSVVVFMSDHGALLGEQGQFLKGPERLRSQVTHVPLLIRLPGKKFAGKHVPGFVQVPDLMPTLLHLLGLKPPPRATGANFWPLVTGATRSLRDHVVQGYGYIAAVRTPEWNYSQVWNPRGYKGTYPPQLYNLAEDPEELSNVAPKHPDVTKRLSALLRDYVASGERITRGSFAEKETFGIGDTYTSKR